MSSKDLENSLIDAAGVGAYDKVLSLLQAGADPNAISDFGRTPLMAAAMDGNKKICQLLLEWKADVHQANDSGSTALMRAADHGREEICQLFLDAGADVNASSNQGFTPLILAAQNGFVNVCRQLYRAGAHVHAQTKSGHSALSKAAKSLRQDAGFFLLRHGVTGAPGDDERTKDVMNNWLAIMAGNARHAFPPERKPYQASWMNADGKEACDALLDACATGQFASLIAAPLLRTHTQEDRELFLKIYRALPAHWREQEAATYMQALQQMQASRTPASPGSGGMAR
jgi:hypothetical protein